MANNQQILCNAWLEGSTAFQQRIPNPSQQGIAATAKALTAPQNNDLWNEFKGLMNMVGFTIVLSRQFENPLNVLKKDPLRYGKSIREIAPKWIKAHAFKDDVEDLLKMHRVEYEQWFHTVNRMDKYLFDYNETELMWAVNEDGASSTINSLLNSAASAAISSDNYDEMNIMINLFATADKNWKRPLFRHHLSAVPTDESTGKEFLTALQSYADMLMFPTTAYNSVNSPVFAKRDELILITTPQTNASVNVNTLSAVFQLDKAETALRKIMIPAFPMPDVVAALTTVDFFQVRDTKYGIYPFFDPNTLTTHNFLHHQGVYSASPYVPCILFTTDAGTVRPVIEVSTSGMTLTAAESQITPGGTVQLFANLLGSVTDNECGISVRPDAALYTVNLKDAPVNSRTYVDRYGILHLQRSAEPGDMVTVTAVSTYVNPSGQTNVYTAEVQLSVVEPEIADTFEVSFNVTGDATYGIPSGGQAPAAIIADADTNVALPTIPVTTWVTSDGTEDGVPGVWAFRGWKASAALTGADLTVITAIKADQTVYGGWTFTAA